MNILLVGEDCESRIEIAKFLRNQGYRLVECENGEDALKAFRPTFHLVLSDIEMPGISGMELLRFINSAPGGRNVDIVLFTGQKDLQLAIEALRAGAYNYLLKPVNYGELAAVAERVAEHQALLRENTALKERFEDTVRAATAEAGEELNRLREALAKSIGLERIGIYSQQMRDIFRRAQAFFGDRSIPVLIQGETGTGKEVIARHIHYGNLDVGTPFVDIDCAALAPSVFESELFGCEAGSFTGGLPGGQKGKLDIASGGTLFLDEITDLPVDLQAKLLRVIEEKEFYRVGGLKKIKADARIICATNVDIEKKVEQGNFRRDLYYRLNAGRLSIPPLRERAEEILPLARLFLREFAGKRNKRFTGISVAAAEMLTSYNWPGNIRELKNSLEAVVLIHDGQEIRPEHLYTLPQFRNAGPSPERLAISGPGRFSLPDGPFNLEELLNSILSQVLEMHNGNKTRAARYLGISRRTLYRRLNSCNKV